MNFLNHFKSKPKQFEIKLLLKHLNISICSKFLLSSLIPLNYRECSYFSKYSIFRHLSRAFCLQNLSLPNFFATFFLASKNIILRFAPKNGPKSRPGSQVEGGGSGSPLPSWGKGCPDTPLVSFPAVPAVVCAVQCTECDVCLCVRVGVCLFVCVRTREFLYANALTRSAPFSTTVRFPSPQMHFLRINSSPVLATGIGIDGILTHPALASRHSAVEWFQAM